MASDHLRASGRSWLRPTGYGCRCEGQEEGPGDAVQEGEDMIPTANILQRTFLVRDHTSLGTAFTIDRNGRQYLVTARHVTQGTSGVIHLFHDGKWKAQDVRAVGSGMDGEDVMVLCADRQLSPTHPVGTNDRGLALGQQVRFLGFPFGWRYEDLGRINNGWPIPIVKGGILSRMSSLHNRRMLVDAHGNKGFSGGPLVAEIARKPVVLGVVVKATPNPDGIETIDEHAGFVEVEPINVVTKIVDSRPTGFQLGEAKA